jgi:hypothetical protein
MILSAPVWSGAVSGRDLQRILKPIRENPGIRRAIVDHVKYLTAYNLPLMSSVYNLPGAHPFVEQLNTERTLAIHETAQALALALAADERGEVLPQIERAIGSQATSQLKSFQLTQKDVEAIRENIGLTRTGESVSSRLVGFARFFENYRGTWNEPRQSPGPVDAGDFPGGAQRTQLRQARPDRTHEVAQAAVEATPEPESPVREMVQIAGIFTSVGVVLASALSFSYIKFPHNMAGLWNEPVNLGILAVAALMGYGVGWLAHRLYEVTENSKRYPTIHVFFLMSVFLIGMLTAATLGLDIPWLTSTFGLFFVISALRNLITRSKDKKEAIMMVLLFLFLFFCFGIAGFCMKHYPGMPETVPMF